MSDRFRMRRTVFCVLAMLGSADASADGENGALKKELHAMAGTWRAVSVERDGKAAPGEALKELVMTRDVSGKVVIRRREMVVLESMVKKLDPSKKPKTIDMEQVVGEHKGKIIQGIYEIDGDTLRVCLAQPGKERPTEFSAKAGSSNALAVYKREKK